MILFKISPCFSQCFIQTTSHGLYLHLPISLFMAVNLILFLTTTFTLHRYRATTRSLVIGRYYLYLLLIG